MLEQFSETTPRPGPRLFKHAPTAENADSKSKPEIKVINNRTTKEITYIEKKPLQENGQNGEKQTLQRD